MRAVFLASFAAAALALLASSCRSTCYVPVETVRTEYKDRTEHLRDSICLHDSITVVQRGDTVFKERWRTEYRDRWRTDSVFIERTDSVQVPYPVERELTRWQQAKQDVGGMAIGGFLIAVAIAVIWLIKKFRK